MSEYASKARRLRKFARLLRTNRSHPTAQKYLRAYERSQGRQPQPRQSTPQAPLLWGFNPFFPPT
jgi:hypothetical protein